MNQKIYTKRKKRIKEGKVKFHILKNGLKPSGFSIKISTKKGSIFIEKVHFIKMFHLNEWLSFFLVFFFWKF